MTQPFPPSIHRPRPEGPDTLDQVAGDALGFLAADSERLRRFFDITGLSVATLRQASTAPGFAASLLDYIAGDERCLLAFASQTGRTPAEIDRLRLALAPPPTES